MALTGRIAILSGGIGGLGSAIGKQLRNKGARLALLYAPFEAQNVKPAIKETYGSSAEDVTAYECDITSPESVATAYLKLTTDLTADAKPNPAFPSILVNAAGHVALSPMEDTTPEETVKHLHINVLGPMLMSQAFAKLYMTAAKAAKEEVEGVPLPPGRIVSLASQAAHVALDKHGAYCASKAALLGLVRQMAFEWGPMGITSNSVSPTVVWTTLGKKAWADDEVREAFQAQIPTRRFAEPEEVASAVSYLVRDDAGMVNGADIRIDGGFTIR